MKFRPLKFALALCLVIGQLSAGMPGLASSRVPAPSEKVIFDKNGKIVVPINDADDISYLGNGLYMLSYWSADPPAFYDIHGNNIPYKLPDGSSFVKIIKEPQQSGGSKDPTQNVLICFRSGGKQGVCDFSGKILMPAKYHSLSQYVGDGTIVAMGESFQEEMVVKFDGTVLSDIKHDGGADDLKPSMMGGSLYTEGRRAVGHAFGTPCALMDLKGKVITNFKFLRIGNFENGIALARLKSDDGQFSALINRQGNVVKRFPKDVDVQEQSGPNRYYYFSGSPPELKQGVIDQNGNIVIPAKYHTLFFHAPSYYFAHTQRNFTELDIFDVDGKLLLHCPHQVTASSLKHPENSSDLTVNLSTLQEFFASRDGAVVSELKNKDGKLCVGLANGKGEWIIPPTFSYCPIQNLARNEVQPIQFAFALPARAFSKDAWDRAEKYHHLGRWPQFELFLREHDLIGMPANEVKSSFGEPISSAGGELSYLISNSLDSQVMTLYLRLDDKNCVSAWRYIYTSHGQGHPARYESPWESRNMTFTEDKDGNPGQLVPKYPSAPGK